jgi:hypothetical protein
LQGEAGERQVSGSPLVAFIQGHGAPAILAHYGTESFHLGLADGATEVHKVTLARQILEDRRGTDDLFPPGHLPRLEAAARSRYADVLEADGRA